MQGRSDSQLALFHTLNIDDFVPQNHLLRKLDQLVSFEFIYEITEDLYCPDNGRPSIDP